MTLKRYRESKSVSRSSRLRPGAEGQHDSQQSQQPPDHYAKLQPAGSSDPNPVDVAIDRSPKLAGLRRKLLRLAKKCQQSAPDQHAFVTYEDLRLQYMVERERLYYNAGHRHGLTLGRAESWMARASSDPVARAFSHKIGLEIALADLPGPRLAATLLEVARAVVLGLPLR
jgi:hypothetical protein